jgi:ribonuclease HI
VSSGGICLGPSMNNVAEYSVVIELLRDAISHGILSLEVHLDSQLVVCQLNEVTMCVILLYSDDSYGYVF